MPLNNVVDILSTLARAAYSPTNYQNTYDPATQQWIDPTTKQPAATQAPYRPASGWQNAFNPEQSQHMRDVDESYITSQSAGDIKRKQALLDSANTTTGDIARASTFANPANKALLPYLGGTDKFNPAGASGVSQWQASVDNGVYPQEAAARKAWATVAPETVPSEIARTRAENTTAASGAENQGFLNRLTGEAFSSPMYSLNYKNGLLNKMQGDNLDATATMKDAGTRLALATDRNDNKDELVQQQQAERSGGMFASRYVDLGAGQALDTVTHKVVPNPRWSMQNILGQSMGVGANKMTNIVDPKDPTKTYQIPFSRDVSVFRRPANQRMGAAPDDGAGDDNAKPIVERPPAAIRKQLPTGTLSVLGNTALNNLEDIGYNKNPLTKGTVEGSKLLYRKALKPLWDYLGGVNQ